MKRQLVVQNKLIFPCGSMCKRWLIFICIQQTSTRNKYIDIDKQELFALRFSHFKQTILTELDFDILLCLSPHCKWLCRALALTREKCEFQTSLNACFLSLLLIKCHTRCLNCYISL